jgi:c(7)-type cytochrome triheme protein
MKLTVLLITMIVATALVGSAFAVPSGKTVEFAGGAQGKVVFDGKVHGDKGLKCNDCHTTLFQMKKGVFKMTTDEHKGDKGCAACHNGTKAFSQTDDANCGKCHKK